jgi:hypothetical protein
VVDQQHVRVPVGRYPDRLPGSHRNHVHLDSRRRREWRQEVIEKARVLRGRRRSDGDRPYLVAAGATDRHAADQGGGQAQRADRLAT